MEVQRLPHGWSAPRSHWKKIFRGLVAGGEIILFFSFSLGALMFVRGLFIAVFRFTSVSTAFLLTISAVALIGGMKGVVGPMAYWWGAKRGSLPLVWLYIVEYYVVLGVAAGLVVLNGGQFIVAHSASFSPAVTTIATDWGAGVLVTFGGYIVLVRWLDSPGALLLPRVREVWDRRAVIEARRPPRKPWEIKDQEQVDRSRY